MTVQRENFKAVKTTCPYCGVGCGVEVKPDGEGGIIIQGDATHPANFGRLCSKGSALHETIGLQGRLLHPHIKGQKTDWDTALDRVAQGFMDVISRHGPDAVAFYVSGQLLTEDYYVANKLMKGFIGSGNIDTNSRLCMSSATAGYLRAFGSDTVPCDYRDVEAADLVVFAGSNLAWCHPVLYQRIIKARQERDTEIIVIDPRRTASCDQADLHLPLKPGTDTALFNGLFYYLHQAGKADKRYIENHTEGCEAALTEAATWRDPRRVAAYCSIEYKDLIRFYERFARHDKTVTLFSMGINQSSSGTDKVNSIINCHLLTGRIGKIGTGPFSITGQPNAMGGREVGGLANILAAHMMFENEDDVALVERFWQASNMARRPGLKAVELFSAIESGAIKAVWIMATNPVVSLPDANRVRDALQRCELVVVSDCVQNTDTTAVADILLPAATWGEKEGSVTNSERRISRQRAFRALPGEARPDWWIISEVGRRMGFAQAFAYQGAADIFREHAALSGYANHGHRSFDISGLSHINNDDYQRLQPRQWPLKTRDTEITSRPFADGRFFTHNSKARFIPIRTRPPVNGTSESYPLVLNSGRIRDQWHTMTRTGTAPRLTAHQPEPLAQIHPEDAMAYDIKKGTLVSIESRWGQMLARASVSDAVPRGSLFAPIHWNAQFAGRGRVGAVVNPVVDPVSGEPEFKHTPVAIRAYHPAWQGFILARTPLSRQLLDHHDYWVQARGDAFHRYEIAAEQSPYDWPARCREMFQWDQATEWLEYQDSAHGNYRLAIVKDERLEVCLFVSNDQHLPDRAWLASLFTKTKLDNDDHLSLLAGRPGEAGQDAGPTICSCFGVGLHRIRKAVCDKGLRTPEAIGRELRAGTNCGSCIPEIKAIIAATESPDAT